MLVFWALLVTRSTNYPIVPYYFYIIPHKKHKKKYSNTTTVHNSAIETRRIITLQTYQAWVHDWHQGRIQEWTDQAAAPIDEK